MSCWTPSPLPLWKMAIASLLFNDCFLYFRRSRGIWQVDSIALPLFPNSGRAAVFLWGQVQNLLWASAQWKSVSSYVFLWVSSPKICQLTSGYVLMHDLYFSATGKDFSDFSSSSKVWALPLVGTETLLLVCTKGSNVWALLLFVTE